MTPQGMQTLTFELTEVVPLERFSDSTALPGAVIVFDHWLEQTAQGLKISHRVTLSGEAQESYVARMGAHLEHGLKNSVEKLAQLLERVRTGV